MAETRTITCVDCGQQVETLRANTKYCSVCRLIRDLPYVLGLGRNCGLCDGRFAPLHVRDHLCGSCTPTSPKYGETECAFCHETRPRFAADIAVCASCARDPKLRKKLWSSLNKKQAARKDAVT